MQSTADPTNPVCAHPVSHPWTSWAAVLAGVTTAVAVQIGLIQLSLALGLMMFEPTDSDSSTATVAFGTVIALFVSALVSVFAGGWVVGRMKCHHTAVEAAIHGMLVWAVAGIATLLLAAMTIGVLAGGAFALLGQAVSGAAQGVGAAVPSSVEAVAPSWDDIKTEVSEAIDQRDANSSEALSDSRFADRSRLMQLLALSFSMDGDGLTTSEEQELAQLLSSQLGISSEAASATYEQWQDTWQDGVNSFQAAAEEAEDMLQEGAELAAMRMSQAALIAFFAMIIGLCAAIAGALVGNVCAMRCLETRTATVNSNPAY